MLSSLYCKNINKNSYINVKIISIILILIFSFSQLTVYGQEDTQQNASIHLAALQGNTEVIKKLIE